MRGNDRVQVFRRGPWWELVSPTCDMVDRLPSRTNFVGAGAGVIAAAGLAALTGSDCSFVRPAVKRYGTMRQHDGKWDGERSTVAAFGTGADREVIDRCIPSVERWVSVEEVTQLDAPPRAMKAARHDRTVVKDFAGRAALLRSGPYVRSNGEIASYYFETLEAAHTYSVASAFASAANPRGVDAAVGVMLGGVYLAAVLAVHNGLRLLMFDPKTEYSRQERWEHAPRRLVFVDDLMNSGKAFRACGRVAKRMEVAKYGYATLYSFGRSCSLGGPAPFVAAVLTPDTGPGTG